MIKKNDQLQIICESTTYDGYGRCFYDEQLILVKGLLPHERADVSVLTVKKKVIFARIIKLINNSEHREKKTCSVYGRCGGCSYQHISYEYQLKMKTQRVKDCLSQIGKIDVEVLDTVPSTHKFRYRNKVQIPASLHEGEFMMGFYRSHSNDIIEFDDCLVQSSKSNEIYHYTKSLIIKYNFQKHIKHILIKHALISNEIMVVLIVNDKGMFGIEEMSLEIANAFSITSIIMNINNGNNNVILGDKEMLLYGKKQIKEQLNNLEFLISSKSFYQINPYQTINLYNKVLELAELTGKELVVDLYCGTGTIGLYLAKKAKRVIGVDIVEDAIVDARANALLNKIDNAEFICADASCVVATIKQKVDVVIVDPPRKGLTETGIDTIVMLKPDVVIYVSCNPSTLARDLVVFKKQGFTVDAVQPFDMFPMTDHVETVVKMTNEIKE